MSAAESKSTASQIELYLQPIGEAEKFSLAKWLLLALGLLFLLGAVASLAVDNGDKIFEACKTLLPPIATLVIGYYFGEKSK
jgi:hypothetical protein